VKMIFKIYVQKLFQLLKKKHQEQFVPKIF
jgi:hypothetical protein